MGVPPVDVPVMVPLVPVVAATLEAERASTLGDPLRCVSGQRRREKRAYLVEDEVGVVPQ